MMLLLLLLLSNWYSKYNSAVLNSKYSTRLGEVADSYDTIGLLTFLSRESWRTYDNINLIILSPSPPTLPCYSSSRALERVLTTHGRGTAARAKPKVRVDFPPHGTIAFCVSYSNFSYMEQGGARQTQSTYHTNDVGTDLEPLRKQSSNSSQKVASGEVKKRSWILAAHYSVVAQKKCWKRHSLEEVLVVIFEKWWSCIKSNLIS